MSQFVKNEASLRKQRLKKTAEDISYTLQYESMSRDWRLTPKSVHTRAYSVQQAKLKEKEELKHEEVYLDIIGSLQKRNFNLEIQNKELKQESIELKKKNESLQTNREVSGCEFQEKIDSLRSEKAILSKRNVALEKRNDDFKELRQKEEKEIKAIVEQNRIFYQEICRHISQETELRSKVSILSKVDTEGQNGLNLKIKEQRRAATLKSAHIETLEGQIKELGETILQLENENNSSKKKRSQQKEKELDKLENYREKLGASESNNATLRLSNEALKNQSHDSARKLNGSESKVDILSENLRVRTGQLDALVNENVMVRELMLATSHEKKVIRSQLEDLQMQLKSVTAEKKQATDRMKRIIGRVSLFCEDRD